MSSACVCHTDEWCFYCEMYLPLEKKSQEQAAEIEKARSLRDFAVKKSNEYAAEIERLRQALEEYAKEDEFHCGNCDQFHRDPEYGNRARQALGGNG